MALVSAPALVLFAVATLWLSVVDIREHRLPNKLVLALTVSLLLALGVQSLVTQELNNFYRALLAALVMFAIYLALALIGPRSLGFGDVKLSFSLGLLLGYKSWDAVWVGLESAFILAGIWALALLVLRKTTVKSHIAFGPFMLAATWIGLFA